MLILHAVGELLTVGEWFLWVKLCGTIVHSNCKSGHVHSHLHFRGVHQTFPETLHECRHIKQVSTSAAAAAAPDKGQPSKATSDYRDQDSSQALSPTVPANLQASETPPEAMIEVPAQISKENRIAAAREKYLARKRQKTG